jgi:hypothetical protein
MNNKEFSQSQGHGLFWDSEIRQSVFKLEACKNDTKKYDIDSHENIFDSSENVSIKTSSNNGFGGGDILRFFNVDLSKKCTIILIKYKQTGSTKKVKEVIEIDYTKEVKDLLFGTITEEILLEYVEMIKAIPAGSVSAEVSKAYKAAKKELQKNHNMLININPKVDSKSQRRVQCSISNIDVILNKIPSVLISKSVDAQVRGVTITESIESEPRKRNKKNV